MSVQQIPQYECHKKVRAFKIGRIDHESEKYTKPVCKGSKALGTACGHCERCRHRNEFGSEYYFLHPENPSIPPLRVPPEFMARATPLPGGYLVIYEDGYMSFSPAAAFESGYTLIPPCEGCGDWHSR